MSKLEIWLDGNVIVDKVAKTLLRLKFCFSSWAVG